MKYRDIESTTTDIVISRNSFSNLFNIEVTDGIYQFLCNRTISILGTVSAHANLYVSHRVSQGDQWSLLSQEYYKTTDLWWVICKFNGIQNPLIFPKVGTIIKIPTAQMADLMVKTIREAE